VENRREMRHMSADIEELKDTEQDTLRERVETSLKSVRPYLQADGGDVELVDVSDEGIVFVRLAGACRGCPGATMTLQMGIERILKEQVPEVKSVQAVQPGPLWK
jgi:Fe-S cluster biogenesis protein NfuA